MPEFRLTPDAEHDLHDIARYTLETWSEQQQRRYEAALIECFKSLADRSARGRQPIAHRPELRQVRCKHHFVFAIELADEPVTIIAVLHEQMDLMARLLDRTDGPAD